MMRQKFERRMEAIRFVTIVFVSLMVAFVNGFPFVADFCMTRHPTIVTRRRNGFALVPLHSKKESSSEDQDENDHHDPKNTNGGAAGGNKTLVTKEMFLREMLQEPAVVKRENNNKRGGGSKRRKEYKVLDNRDSLPFAVKVSTPDPYTHPDIKRKNAQKIKKRRNNADAIENHIASRLYGIGPGTTGGGGSGEKGDPEDVETLLGEYELDKHTTTGDLLEIGDTQYRVVKHRCLYKYAGGQRFVMVRKILHVKEVGRLQAEEYLARQFKRSGGGENTNRMDQ